MILIDKLAEAQIQAAMERGEFDDLPGSGEPLALDDDTHIPEELRTAYRLLKNAGCLPPEVEWRREIYSAEQLLRESRLSEERSGVASRLSVLMARLSLARGREMDLRVEQEYFQKLSHRFDPNPGCDKGET